jgi:histidyl-tRNA synthetase
MPFKRYEFGKVFRNGPVKAGRNREFWQCDVDIAGDGSIEAEAELIQLAVKCYTDMGILPIIKIGNRKLLSGLAELAGASAKNQDEIIGIIDKIEKADKDETLTALSKYMPKESAKLLMQYIGLEIDGIEKLLPGNDGIAEIKKLFARLEELKIANSCIFAPSLARGLNVYTGTVWEVFDKSGRCSSSLGGGGRYDKIITNFIDNGMQYPAVGISFGLEPITAVLSKDTEERNIADLLTVPFGTYKQANYLVEKLRDAGVKVMLWTANEKVSKALEYANAAKIKFVTVIGENETVSKTVKIKNMQTGKEEIFNIDAINKIAKFILMM